MKKTIGIILLILLLFFLKDADVFKGKEKDPAFVTVPEDFCFSITWGCYGISSYDSATGTLIKTKDATHPEDYITTLHLTEEQLKEAYLKLTEEIDLYAYNHKYNPFPSGYASSPTQTIILSIKENGKEKTVLCENIPFGDESKMKNKKARRFMRVKDEIVDMICDTKEWKSCPDYEFGYD